MDENEKKPTTGPLGPPVLENSGEDNAPKTETISEMLPTKEEPATPDGYAKSPEPTPDTTQPPAGEQSPSTSEPGYVVDESSAVPVATTQNDKKKKSAVLPIIVAVLTVVLLVVIGVAALRLSDEDAEDADENQQQAQPVDEAELDQQSSEIDQTEQDLQELEQDLETNDITDENVGL